MFLFRRESKRAITSWSQFYISANPNSSPIMNLSAIKGFKKCIYFIVSILNMMYLLFIPNNI